MSAKKVEDTSKEKALENAIKHAEKSLLNHKESSDFYIGKMKSILRDRYITGLEIDDKDVYQVNGPLDISAFMFFATVEGFYNLKFCVLLIIIIYFCLLINRFCIYFILKNCFHTQLKLTAKIFQTFSQRSISLNLYSLF